MMADEVSEAPNDTTKLLGTVAAVSYVGRAVADSESRVVRTMIDAFAHGRGSASGQQGPESPRPPAPPSGQE